MYYSTSTEINGERLQYSAKSYQHGRLGGGNS